MEFALKFPLGRRILKFPFRLKNKPLKTLVMQIFYSFIILAGLFLSQIPAHHSTNYYSTKKIETPTGIIPVNGAIVDTGKTTFCWSKTGAKHVYELMIARNQDFTDGQRYSSKDTTLTLNLKYADNVVYWRVRAFASKQNYSEWSQVSVFYPGINVLNNNNNRAPCGKIGGCGGCQHPCGGRRQYIEWPLDKPE
jgi:hypothetical protein